MDAALRGEEVLIANRSKAAVRLVKVEPAVKRRSGAWVGLMSEAEIDAAFAPEMEAEMAREALAGADAPLDAGLKTRRAAGKEASRPA